MGTEKYCSLWDMLPNVFQVLGGLDVTDEWGQVTPMLQFAPIICP